MEENSTGTNSTEVAVKVDSFNPKVKLKPEVKKLWIEALSSGNYPQGIGALRYYRDKVEDAKYCCLGVLTDVTIKHCSDKKLQWEENFASKTPGTSYTKFFKVTLAPDYEPDMQVSLHDYASTSGHLYTMVREWAFASAEESGLNENEWFEAINNIQQHLIYLNDNFRCSFKQISDYIENFL